LAWFFLVLLAAAAVTLAGRVSVQVARLSAALGAGTALLVAIWLACAVACALAAWLGAGMAAQLLPEANSMLAAVALLLAGLELALLRPGVAPVEPTRSLSAISLVLSGSQLTAAASFLVFAVAAKTGEPRLAAAGGAIGSGAAFSAAWALGSEWEARRPLRWMRHGIAAAMMLTALVTGLGARGIVG
jgi:hypothetical protein